MLLLLAVTDLSAAEINIVVLKSQDIAPYNIALKGFREALNKERIRVKLIEYDIKKIKEAAGEIRSEKPDLILSLGSRATKILHEEIKKIPIVFSMVLEPESSGFVGDNITGVSLDIAPELEFQMLKRIIPGVKRIGVIYNPEETQAVINNAQVSAEILGLKLVTRKINSIEEIPATLRNIRKNIEVLWMVADPTVYTPKSTEHILLYTLREGIPVVGLSPSYVKAGALFSLSCDYEDIGRQSAEIAVQIIKGATPANVPIAVPRKTVLTLNLITAERIGIEIPKEIIRKAGEIYK